MLRTEYHGQSEHLLSLALPRRREGEDEDSSGPGITSAQSIVLFGTPYYLKRPFLSSTARTSFQALSMAR